MVLNTGLLYYHMCMWVIYGIKAVPDDVCGELERLVLCDRVQRVGVKRRCLDANDVGHARHVDLMLQ